MQAHDSPGTERPALENLANPILNGPYDPPARHFEVDQEGPTGTILAGRRSSESYLPIAPERKRAPGQADQPALDLRATGEHLEQHEFVNALRRDVDLWRRRGYPSVTAITRDLLLYWADPAKENRVMFCQREAAETAIFLAEAAGRQSHTDWDAALSQVNDRYNAGLPRMALKMATGSGKTVVMAMLIAWQTLNKIAKPRDSRFCRQFLVVTPGITIRDRLRVLQPNDPGNYYDQRDLVPASLRGQLGQARIVLTNFQSFQPRETQETQGVSRRTRDILRAGQRASQNPDPFTETPDAVVARVLLSLSIGTRRARGNEVVVFCDEAHHCYKYKPESSSAANAHRKLSAEERREQDEQRKEAGIWFEGLRAVEHRVGIKQMFDLSATPYFISGSGYEEGTIFPWTITDFGLMDAIESGIVKIPRTPVDDDAIGSQVVYLHLWDHIGKELPKRRSAKLDALDHWTPPEALEGALRSLYRSYETSFTDWHQRLEDAGETPPVFIVVCSNTVVSRLVYEWISGKIVRREDGSEVVRPGRLPLFSNFDDSRHPLARRRTILVDSVALESGEPLSGEFKAAAADEIETFKTDYRIQHPGADVSKLTDEDILREVMNTVGKPGLLGAQVRCVVSVSMLTEGWDANTVTHILGVRAFSTQLLCEQVVGRGLRRRSYALDEQSRFTPEYASIYGIPFAFIPGSGTLPPPPPSSPSTHVSSVPGRERYRITFPNVQGYRYEIPETGLHINEAAAEPLVIGPSTVPTRTVSSGVVGASVEDRVDGEQVRTQQIAFAAAKALLESHFQSDALSTEGARRPWLFPQLVALCQEWIRRFVQVRPGYSLANLGLEGARDRLADRVYRSIQYQVAGPDARKIVRPILRTFEPVGDTGRVGFATRKQVVATTHSEVSHVAIDSAGGSGGNTWEQLVADECEVLASGPGGPVAAYVKNDHLGLEIPYSVGGQTHAYVPDFLVRLQPGEDGIVRTLIIEVSGAKKMQTNPEATHMKADVARNTWCAAINNHGGFGRWGYAELTTMVDVREQIREAIRLLYADAPIIGDPDVLDLTDVSMAGQDTRELDARGQDNTHREH